MTNKSRKPSAHDHIEHAIASLIASGKRGLLDHASWLAEQLPARRQRRAFKLIVAAI